jgi:hypothetical protein
MRHHTLSLSVLHSLLINPQPCSCLTILRPTAQLAVNHLTESQKRIRIDLKKSLNLDRLLDRLDQVRNIFDIRVEQGGNSVYVMDLNGCFEYLSSIRQQLNGAEHDLRTFIDRDIMKCNDWTKCVTDCDPKGDQLVCFCYCLLLLPPLSPCISCRTINQPAPHACATGRRLTKSFPRKQSLLTTWNTMPSRATFSYIWKRQTSPSGARLEETMHPEKLDRENVILAAYLSRIIARKLEVEAYTELQRILNRGQATSDSEVLSLLHKLGRILNSLRWRVSWWSTLGGGGSSTQDKDAERGKERFEERVNGLCRVLYFYYCGLRRKLPIWTGAAGNLMGVRAKYADTEVEVFDNFPGLESIEGFELWMHEGKELIDKAGVRPKLQSVGLPVHVQ